LLQASLSVDNFLPELRCPNYHRIDTIEPVVARALTIVSAVRNPKSLSVANRQNYQKASGM
jgi:hypothetical protein